MAKITRKTQKIFASAATNNGQFGSAQTGAKVNSTDPDVLQALTAWVNGWNDAVISGSRLPTLEEMQGIQYVSTRSIAYILQEGIAEYDAGTEYNANSIVKKPATYEIYGSITNLNTGNALPSAVDNANWKYLGNLANLILAGTSTSKINNFRLSLTSGVPVPTSDVTGATTIFCTPYVGNSISLYDGANWNVRTSSQFSLALGTLTSSRPYDVFCYDNATVPTLEFTAWTSDTARATALVYQDGILVKSGAVTRRYLGTFYTTSATTTTDSIANRSLYNYYHRVTRSVSVVDATANWTQATGTFRQANANTNNKVTIMVGVAEGMLELRADARGGSSSGYGIYLGIGVNSTSVNSSTTFGGTADFGNSDSGLAWAQYASVPPLGFTTFNWLEGNSSAGTATWYGTSSVAAATTKSGMTGRLLL